MQVGNEIENSIIQSPFKAMPFLSYDEHYKTINNW